MRQKPVNEITTAPLICLIFKMKTTDMRFENSGEKFTQVLEDLPDIY